MFDVNCWWMFASFNGPPLFGDGTEDEAEQYAGMLNSNRSTNFYYPKAIADEHAEGLDLENNTEAFNIAEELSND
jgi:hypothetical protein